MSSDDGHERRIPSLASVTATGFSDDAMDAMEQFRKDLNVVGALIPEYADKIDTLGKKNAFITAAEFCGLLMHDEHRLTQEASVFLPRNPFAHDSRAEQVMQILSDYEFAEKTLADRARYFCADWYEAHGLNTTIKRAAFDAVTKASAEPLFYQLERRRPYGPDIHHIRREAVWKRVFPDLMLTELLDMIGDALHDAHYPRLLATENMMWGERFIALDTFIDKKITDDCEDVIISGDEVHPDICRHSFRFLPIDPRKVDEFEFDYGVGKNTPGLDEILYSRSYLFDLAHIKETLDLGVGDPKLQSFETVLRTYYLASHALAYERVARAAEGSLRPDITFETYPDLVKAQRHMMAHEMQVYLENVRERFASLHRDDDACLIGEEWDLMLREE